MPDSGSAGRPWHGPRIILATFASFFVSTGFTFSVYGVLLVDMATSFAATMAVMGLMPTIYHAMSGGIAPLLGRHLVRLGIRRVMLAGACLLPIGLIGVSRAETAGEAALYFGGLCVLGSLAVGPLPSTTLLTNWYGASRGRAMGLAAGGSTAAGMLLPLLASFALAWADWREVLAGLAILAATIGIPAVWILVVDTPAQIGQEPEGEASRGEARPPAEEKPADAPQTNVDPKDFSPTSALVARREFWLISVMFALLFSSSLVQITYFAKYAVDLGMTLQEAGTVMSVRAAGAFVGQIGLAWLSDRIGRRRVLAGVIAAQAVLWWVLVDPSNLGVFVAVAIGFGFVSGSIMPIRSAMVAAVFGRENFSKASGLMVPAALPFQIAAVPIAGILFDRTQSFGEAFSAFLFVFPVALVLLAFIRDPKPVVSPAMSP